MTPHDLRRRGTGEHQADLVEHLVEWTHDAPLLLVCLARPELLEERPFWGGGKPNVSSLLLKPLGPEESETLLETLPGGARLSDPLGHE